MSAIKVTKKKLRRSSPNIEFQFLVFGHNGQEVDQVHELPIHTLALDSDPINFNDNLSP